MGFLDLGHVSVSCFCWILKLAFDASPPYRGLLLTSFPDSPEGIYISIVVITQAFLT